MASSQGFSGVYLSALVSARAEIPNEGYPPDLDPDSWVVKRFNEPNKRNYFYYSESSNPCGELPIDEAFLLYEGKACCDVIYEVEHPSCRGVMVSKLTGRIRELAELGGTKQP
jgi:hypothetical protein